MYLIKENINNLFGTQYGIVIFDGMYLTLTFRTNVKYKRNSWKVNDSLSRELFTKQEFDSFLKEFKIKKMPFEIFDEDLLKEIIDYLQS